MTVPHFSTCKMDVEVAFTVILLRRLSELIVEDIYNSMRLQPIANAMQVSTLM